MVTSTTIITICLGTPEMVMANHPITCLPTILPTSLITQESIQEDTPLNRGMSSILRLRTLNLETVCPTAKMVRTVCRTITWKNLKLITMAIIHPTIKMEISILIIG